MTKIKAGTSSKRKLISHSDQLPDFSKMSWEEEDEFWQTHDFTDDVLVEDEEAAAAFYKGIGIEDPRVSHDESNGEPLENG